MAQKDVVYIERTLPASREDVWKALTEAERIKKWWGPKDFTAPVVKIDFKEGGKYIYCMRTPDGQDLYSTGTISKIDAPSKIVFSDSFSDEKGNIVPARDYGMPDNIPDVLTVTMQLQEITPSQTKLTLTHEGFPPGEIIEQCTQGWNESFDKLEKSLRTEERGAELLT